MEAVEYEPAVVSIVTSQVTPTPETVPETGIASGVEMPRSRVIW